MNLTHEAIARKAFEIWEREGRPEGRDLEHWIRAEAELKSPALENLIAAPIHSSLPVLLQAAPLPAPAKPGKPAKEVKSTAEPGPRSVRPAPGQPSRAQTRSRL